MMRTNCGNFFPKIKPKHNPKDIPYDLNSRKNDSKLNFYKEQWINLDLWESYQETQVDKFADYGIRYEKTLHRDTQSEHCTEPVLITSFPLPRVKGIGYAPKLGFRNASTQTRSNDLTKVFFDRVPDLRAWHSEIGVPFIELMRKEIMKNKPVNLEDFMISFCEARLNGDPTPETIEGHKGNGGDLCLKKTSLIRTRTSVNMNGSFRGLSGEGSSSNRKGSIKLAEEVLLNRTKRVQIKEQNDDMKRDSDTEKEIYQEAELENPNSNLNPNTIIETESFAGMSLKDLPILSMSSSLNTNPKGIRGSFNNLLSPMSDEE